MRPAKPDLLESLPSGSVFGFLGTPKSSCVRFSVFIDGERVVGILHEGAQLGIVEAVRLYIKMLEGFEWYTQGSYSIPYPNELDVDVA
jgi:hypothetical protein